MAINGTPWFMGAVLPPTTHRLADVKVTDVAIVGGGCTGLSTALHVALSGLDVILVEAGEIGQGASGLNGGQVTPGFSPYHHFENYERKTGITDFAWSFVDRAPSLVFDLVRDMALHCFAANTGWLQLAQTQRGAERFARYARALQARGVKVKFLDQPRAAQQLQTTYFKGGLLFERGGVLNPLSYSRELARVAISYGAKIFTKSPVTNISQHGNAWEVHCPDGRVRAQHLVLAVDGLLGRLFPPYRDVCVNLPSQQICVNLPAMCRVLQSELPAPGHIGPGPGAYFRIVRQDGLLVIGGPSIMRRQVSPDALLHQLGLIYPDMTEASVTHNWVGLSTVTKTGLPYFFAPQRGIIAAGGYNGCGISAGTAVGKMIADHVREGTPLVVGPFGPNRLFDKLEVSAALARRLWDRSRLVAKRFAR